MGLQSRRGLLQHGNGQVVGGSKTQGVAVVADMPMRPPGPSRDAPALMMRRQAATLSHKTKRGLRRHPGKPLGGVWLKREEPLLGADHDVASFCSILDTRQDLSWLAGRFGYGTRARSRGGGPRWALGRPGLLGRSQRHGGLWPVLLKEASESSHLLLQCGNLGLQDAQRLWQRQQRGGQRRHLAGGEGCRRLLWEGSQAALMQASQRLQVLLAHPFFAAIVGIALQGKLGISQPAAQRFGIDAKATTRLGQRHKGHRATPFVWDVQQERESAWETSQENSTEDSQEKSWEGWA